MLFQIILQDDEQTMISALDTSLLQKTRPLSENPDELDDFLKQLSQSADDNAIDRVISLYKNTIVRLEQKIWKNKTIQEDIEQYQNTFIILEKLHELKTTDTRYNFKIVIPVADRPQHLKHCLDSLLTLCKCYGYGGYKNKQFNKISVLIADDSRDINNIKHHKSYCSELTAQGINTEYFGLKEQLRLVKETTAENSCLSRIISNAEDINDPISFSHKGASIMRNITYLKLNQTLSQGKKNKNTLIYFIDSDQEFCINITNSAINPALNSNGNFYAINYFHYLNEIFKTQDISILTGKVVGDPPVSPSVMAGNFQQDIQHFLNTIEKSNPNGPCQFHQHETNTKDDAAYHDMANLFGFKPATESYGYRCTIRGDHDHAACLEDFSSKLNNFFYGEHPTRKSYYDQAQCAAETTPARTIYTGNYIFNAEGLDYFIPFASLKLRMAGPVLGRLIRSEMQQRFVSANLPMLHKRTVEQSGESEFRPGIESGVERVDLSGEFERQFFGDVMLCTIERLVEMGFPRQGVSRSVISQTLESVEDEMRQRYSQTQREIMEKSRRLHALFFDSDNWWNRNSGLELVEENFGKFLDSIDTNFGRDSKSFQRIDSQANREQRHAGMIEAITAYADERQAWKQALAERH